MFCGCYRDWEVVWRQGEGQMEMTEGVMTITVLTSGGVDCGLAGFSEVGKDVVQHAKYLDCGL